MYSALICEDESAQRGILTRLIDWEKYNFRSPVLCTDAEEALEEMKRQPFDFLLSEVGRHGWVGPELEKKCRELNSGLYAVMIVGVSEFYPYRWAVQTGKTRCVLKPVRPVDVHHELGMFLQRKRSAGEDNRAVDPAAEELMHFVEEHAMEYSSAIALAKGTGMKLSDMNALFRQNYGFVVEEHMYMLQRERACHLLGATEITMREIARTTGGRSPTNFVWWFRKCTDMTPKDYRHLISYGKL